MNTATEEFIGSFKALLKRYNIHITRELADLMMTTKLFGGFLMTQNG